MLSCFSSNYRDKFTPIIRNLDLEENRRKIILTRFLEEVVLYDKKAKVAEFFYICFSLIITIGSVVLPALLSIQNVDFSEDEDVDATYRERVYWFCWALSLLISICNGLIQLLSLNKQYSSYIIVRENLVSEGWKYLELCDNYSTGTHKDNFTKFCEEIEEIKKSQTDREAVFLNHKGSKNTPENPDNTQRDDEGQNQDRRQSQVFTQEGQNQDRRQSQAFTQEESV